MIGYWTNVMDGLQGPAWAWHYLQSCFQTSCCYDSIRNQNAAEKQYLEQTGQDRLHANLTIDQLAAARNGDRAAMNQLFERLAPPLQRWARGRLPGWARGMVSTVDLVQDALMSTYLALDTGQPGSDLAIHAYVRTALKNRLIDQLRKVQRRPELAEMDRTHESMTASPLDAAIGSEALDRYERSLGALSPAEREAVIARIELGLPFSEIATLLGKASDDAARMAVSRAMVKLAEAMGDE